MNSTRITRPSTPATRPYTTPRATVVAGTTVLSRMVPTTDSMVFAACTVQSLPELVGGAAAGGREVTSAMWGRLPSAAHAPTCRRGGGRGGGDARGPDR